ncbi:MAG: Holliday junction branch migration protein RuvA [Puniceicoccaceae bacterium]
MIVFVEGKLSDVDLLSAVVEVGGIGYFVRISLITAGNLPPIGSSVKLYTSFVVREDAQELYGFHRPEDRDTFQKITQKVSGVGPKLALSILSHFDSVALATLIREGDVTTLSKCPGIGKKTAERLIVDLRGSLPASSLAPSGDATPERGAPLNSAQTDAVLALVALGYREAEAAKAVDRAIKNSKVALSTDELIRASLR